MKRHSWIGVLWIATTPCVVSVAHAQAAQPQTASPAAQEQWEADYRVIAARCGTPAFEKAFSAQSRGMVAAGLVSRRAEPAVVEKSVASLRRSSLTLVATSSDCPGKLAELKALQQSRQAALASARRGGTTAVSTNVR